MYHSGHDHKYEAEGHPGPAPTSIYQSSNMAPPGPPPPPPPPPFLSPALHVPGLPGRWSSGLCHCCNDPVNCVITCFCPCITFGQISEIINRGSTTCATTGTLYGLSCLTGFACLYSCFYRSKMRGQYDLAESPCVDCLVHFFCECCALCQEYRELVNRGYDMGIGWDANLDRQRRGVTIAPVLETHMSR